MSDSTDSRGEFITREEFIDAMASEFEQLAEETEEEWRAEGDAYERGRLGGKTSAYRDAARRIREWGEK